VTETAYRDITCDGCLVGWTLSEGENPLRYLAGSKWIQKGDKHYCSDCQVKGKAAEQLELGEVVKSNMIEGAGRIP
jgi:hypothetical protein